MTFDRRFATVCAVVATTATLVWATSAVLMAGRGFDITDEGFYLLSYRWWHEDPRNFTGAQYLYGPVFQALGYDIAGLRLFRLVTVLAAHVWFAWSFVGWLQARRREAFASGTWKYAGAAAIVASGGLIYSWAPMTPGYNDVVALGVVTALGLVFRTARAAGQSQRVPWWIPSALGVLALAMVLSKWSSAVVLLLIAGVALNIVRPLGARAVARFAGLGLAAVVLATVLFQILVAPLDVVVPQMLDVNRLASQESSPPVTLLHRYVRQVLSFVRYVIEHQVALLLVTVATLFLRRGLARVIGGVLGGAVFVWSAYEIYLSHGVEGGTAFRVFYGAGLVAMAAVVGIVAMASLASNRQQRGTVEPSSTGAGSLALAGLLLLTPIVQGLGTNASILFTLLNCFAPWLAVMIWGLTVIDRVPVTSRWLAFAAAGFAVVATASIASNGLLEHPYRTVGYSAATTTFAARAPVSSVRVTASEAREYAGLRDALAPYLRREGTRILTLDKMPGLVLLLGGRPTGEVWTGAAAPTRSAAGLVASCEDRSVGRSRPPLVLYNREPTTSDRAAFATCDLDLDLDYRVLPVEEGPPGVTVLVPLAL